MMKIKVVKTKKKSLLNFIGIKIYFNNVEIHHGYIGGLIFLTGLLTNCIILMYVGGILILDDLIFHVLERVRG